LVDTSGWVDFLRSGDATLASLLERSLVCSHPFVVGELACGSLRNRDAIPGLLSTLPMTARVDDGEVLHFLEKQRLYGRGLGLVDIHLPAACRVDRCRLWTHDRRLRAAAEELGVGTAVL
jgi:predicted nucleic acid-binding protein